MTTARPSPLVNSPKIAHALSNARQVSPESEMWVAVIFLAIFDATRRVEISREAASPGAKKWRMEEFRKRTVVKDEARKWLQRSCVDAWGRVNVLALLDIDPSWFHRIVSQAHPELR